MSGPFGEHSISLTRRNQLLEEESKILREVIDSSVVNSFGMKKLRDADAIRAELNKFPLPKD